MAGNNVLEEHHRFSAYFFGVLGMALGQLVFLLALTPFIDIVVSVGWNWSLIQDRTDLLLTVLSYPENIPRFYFKLYSGLITKAGFLESLNPVDLYIKTSVLVTVLGYFLIVSENPFLIVRTLHGSSRFATISDLKRWAQDREISLGYMNWKACFLPPAFFLLLIFERSKGQQLIDTTGVCLGLFKGLMLRTSETLSTLLLASPGAGKTSGVAVPTLLSEGMSEWSQFVFDIKGELYETTAGYRSTFGPVFCFDPRGGEGARWNPLSFDKSLPRGKEMVEAYKKVLVNLELIFGNEPDPDDKFETTIGKFAWAELHKLVTDTDWNQRKVELYDNPEILAKNYSRYEKLLIPVEQVRTVLRTEIFPAVEIINAAHSKQEDYLGRMVQALIPDQPGSGGNTDHFAKTGRAALLGMLGFTIWRCLSEGLEPNMARFIDAWTGAALDADTSNSQSEDDDAISVLLDEWIIECQIKGYPRRYLQELTSLRKKPGRERGSVVSTADAALNIFKTDSVRKQTATSDFSLDDFRGIEGPDGISRPITFYLVVSLEDIKFMAPLMTMMAEALIAHLLSQPAKYAATARKVLFLLDEFAQINKMDNLLRLPAVGRGQRVSVLLIAQSEGQIEETYGQTGLKQIIDTTEFKIIFPLTDPQTAEKWSRAIGNRTVREETGGSSGTGGISALFSSNSNQGTNISRNWSFKGLPLVTQSQLMSEESGGPIEAGSHLVLARRRFQRPIQCKTPYWFKDEEMKEHNSIPAPKRSEAKGYCGVIAAELGIEVLEIEKDAHFDLSKEDAA